eukprot:CAMPEP_0177290552 /NCGR_PEP_ID=MMETSP0367-20130122/75810_1 /TAXON_ID=447022 ORGANISM="Scrippsiella hangoei-like, Strain SHHI-4" /NCGR_SAMPLE_ID=MMETSP0367 /ASSEMBLY_ACC=CAM_ASM_000362 /LENGTH=200 /DNA_ID=CAMNT_0018748059 /DNA_START=8 /DNA_END=607 /DNA_ORIENTATION=+
MNFTTEFRKRALVFAGLILVLALPMWVWPWYCQGMLWIGLLAGMVEWWASTWNALQEGLLQDAPWMISTFCAWVAPTIIMVMQCEQVLGHRRVVECIFIQLVVGDTAQLLCGRTFGHTRICGSLSPGKTLEGYAGGMMLTILYGAVVHKWPLGDIVIAFVAGCAGDLFFSSVKRRLRIKDFSRILSAHGGILDRLDSFIF